MLDRVVRLPGAPFLLARGIRLGGMYSRISSWKVRVYGYALVVDVSENERESVANE